MIIYLISFICIQHKRKKYGVIPRVDGTFWKNVFFLRIPQSEKPTLKIHLRPHIELNCKFEDPMVYCNCNRPWRLRIESFLSFFNPKKNPYDLIENFFVVKPIVQLPIDFYLNSLVYSSCRIYQSKFFIYTRSVHYQKRVSVCFNIINTKIQIQKRV